MTQVRLTLGWIAHAVGGRLVDGRAETEIGDVVIDSRAAHAGDLFVAIRGPRFDGHDFVDDVLARGAAAAIVDATADVETGLDERGAEDVAALEGRGRPSGRQRPSIEVGDTVKALQDLAHAVRIASGTKVIAITGSAGKTTTKETIAAFLGRRKTVVKNKGNLNNHIGLPLSLLQVRNGPDVAVMELGMNHAGEISTLVAIAEPDIRVWTNVGDAHIGFFRSPDAIADAKAEILEGASTATVLVCNADDPLVMSRVGAFAGRTITFGTAPGADVRAVDIEDRGLAGMTARVVTAGGESAAMQTPLLGRGNLSNVLAATAVAVELGIPLSEVAEAAAVLRPANRRGAVIHLATGLTVIDDSYNSSPSALVNALHVLSRERAAVRRIAVLGEMLELGDHSTRLHAESGRAVAGSDVDVLFAIGGSAAKALADAAVDAGMSAESVMHFPTSEAATSAVVGTVRPGDVVLVKGSRGVRTDVVVDRLEAELG